MRVKDRWAAARGVGEVLGPPEVTAHCPFAELKFDNAASLDFMDTEGDIHGQHYAFLVSEEEFDLILGRLGDDGRQWWADPFRVNRMRSTPRAVAAASTGRARRALAGVHHLSVRQRRVMSRTAAWAYPPDRLRLRETSASLRPGSDATPPDMRGVYRRERVEP